MITQSIAGAGPMVAHMPSATTGIRVRRDLLRVGRGHRDLPRELRRHAPHLVGADDSAHRLRVRSWAGAGYFVEVEHDAVGAPDMFVVHRLADGARAAIPRVVASDPRPFYGPYVLITASEIVVAGPAVPTLDDVVRIDLAALAFR